jgi:hypothetical protein
VANCTAHEELVSTDENCVNPLFSEGCKGCIDIVICAGVNHLDLPSNRRSSCLSLSDQRFGNPTVWID